MSAVAAAERLGFGRVVGETVRIVRTGFLPLAALALVLDGLPNAVAGYFTAGQAPLSWPYAAVIVLSVVGAVLAVDALAGAVALPAGDTEGVDIVSLVGETLAGMVFEVIISAGAVVTYAELRRVREGTSFGLAEIFS